MGTHTLSADDLDILEVDDLTLEGDGVREGMHSTDPNEVMPKVPQGELWKKLNISRQLVSSQRSPVPCSSANTH